MRVDYAKIINSLIPGFLLIGTAIGMLGAVLFFELFPATVQYLAVAGWVVLSTLYGTHKVVESIRIERASGLTEVSE